MLIKTKVINNNRAYLPINKDIIEVNKPIKIYSSSKKVTFKNTSFIVFLEKAVNNG